MVSLMNSLRTRSANRRAENELNRLSDRELADLGIYRADISTVIRGNRRLD